MRKIILALFALLALTSLVAAQGGAGGSPPNVPALPDAPRINDYDLSGSTCACSVGFALYGDGTDVDAWIAVSINGVRYLSTDPAHGWKLTSATGSLGSIPLPITDAVLTFNAPQTGTVVILGARRPRRVSQFPEDRGIDARSLNQVITDIVAQNREQWDELATTIRGQPGEVLLPLPNALARAGMVLGFDGNGQPIVEPPGGGGGGGGGACASLSTACTWTAPQSFIGNNLVPITTAGFQIAIQNSSVTQGQIFGPVTAITGAVWDAVQSVVYIPPNSTILNAEAFGAYVRNRSASSGMSGGGGVGYYGLFTCGVTGTSCWAENYRIVDCENVSSCSGIQNAVLIAGEDDFYVGNTCAAGVTGPCVSGGNGPTTVGARSVILSSFMDRQPNFAFGWSCSNVSTISGNNPPFWNSCFSSLNGAAAVAFSIGSLKHVPPCATAGQNPPCPPAPVVANSASQSIAFSYTDATGAFQNWQMFVDVAGTLQFQSTQPTAAFSVGGLEADKSLLVGPSGMPLFEVGIGGTTNVTFPALTGPAGSACLDVSGNIFKSATCPGGGGGGGGVGSVTNADGSLTFSPTTGAVVGSLNLAHANTWTAPLAVSLPAPLAPGASALVVSATQPAGPTAAQAAIIYNITSAGNANQTNIGWVFNYLAGYTGTANTSALNIGNAAASTANTLNGGPGVNPVSGNIGTSSNTFGTTTGLNVGDRAIASNGQTNVGFIGLANVAGGAGTTNLGSVGSAFNNAGGAMIGGYFNLAQTVTPTVQAALVADNGVQAAPIALFRNNGATVASVTQTGGLTGTLPASAGGGGLFVCVDTSGVLYKKATCP
jgi:hypothetical protein